VTDIDIGAFLSRGPRNPEHQALLRLIGKLMEGGADAEGAAKRLVASKPVNGGGRPSSEPVEQRGEAEGKARHPGTLRTPSREGVRGIGASTDSREAEEERAVHRAPAPVSIDLLRLFPAQAASGGRGGTVSPGRTTGGTWDGSSAIGSR
jgi:hypothetical protein